MFTASVTIVATSTARTMARPRFTTTTIRRRSNRSAAAPPMTPNSRNGRYSLNSASETRNGSRVCDATSSGPAAMRDAVADVVDERRRQEPAEAPTEPRRRDGLDDPGGKGAHRRQDTNRCGPLPRSHNEVVPYDLDRFLGEQARVYDGVLDELRRGRKTGHWIWFIFPQVAGLGHSAMSQRFAISSLDEARAYLAHPVPGRSAARVRRDPPRDRRTDRRGRSSARPTR